MTFDDQFPPLHVIDVEPELGVVWFQVAVPDWTPTVDASYLEMIQEYVNRLFAQASLTRQQIRAQLRLETEGWNGGPGPDAMYQAREDSQRWRTGLRKGERPVW